MKPQNTPNGRAKAFLAIGLAGLLSTSTAYAQSTDSNAFRQLQEENAALRKRLAELETKTQPASAADAPAAAQPAAPAARPAPAVADEPTDKGVLVLSPFSVSAEKDYGYLKTNSATATRIGTEIQRVPLSISVISEDFINDTQLKDIQDVLRYQSSSAGDTRMGVLQPATGFTPSGNMSLRGFPINARLRNGLLRYNNYSLDNVERVEVIKGPAAVFFGQSYPGGVINYVTKKPSFSKIPTSITYGYGGWDTRMGSQRMTLDHNAVLSDKAAMRFVSAWDNLVGDRRFEFQDGFSFTPSLTFLPFNDGRLRVTLEAEFVRRQRNQDDTSWTWPKGWFEAYQNPSAALIAAAGLTNNANPVAAYRTRILTNINNYAADMRVAAGRPDLALFTESMQHGAYITDKAGNRILDEKFNYYGSGTYSDEENSTLAVVTEYSPTDWVDIRHSFTSEQNRYTEIKASASPYADGVRWQTLNGLVARDYIQEGETHQLDVVLKADFAGMKNKLLLGGLSREMYNTFTGNIGHANLNPFYGYLPGAYDKPDEGYVSPIPAAFRHPQGTGWGYASQFLRDRTGKIITPQQIFSEYDPGVHIYPAIGRIMELSRGLTDHSRPKREEWYVNWQGQALEDRLTVMAGYRKEKQTTPGQLVKANPPWFEVGDYALENIPQSLWATYGLSAIFSRPSRNEGNSKLVGASYEINKNLNVYSSYSKTFIPSGVKYMGGDYDPQTVRNRATALGLNPDTEIARLESQGGLREMQNETGENAEIGIKISTDDSKLVGTASVFVLERANRTVDDSPRQTDEILNWLGPNRTGAFNRIVRWYSNDAVERTKGLEFDLVWTPIRNYQAIIAGSWMWEAKTLSDPSVAPTAAIAPIVFGERLPFVPEYRFSYWNKYTFTDNFVGDFGSGLSIGGGLRYSSKMNISIRDMNYNPRTGGLTAGDYVVFDAVINYPFEVFGYRMTSSLAINNLLDEEYSEGGLNLSPPRSWMLTLGMKF